MLASEQGGDAFAYDSVLSVAKPDTVDHDEAFPFTDPGSERGISLLQLVGRGLPTMNE